MDLYTEDYLWAQSVAADSRLDDKEVDFISSDLVHHINCGIFDDRKKGEEKIFTNIFEKWSTRYAAVRFSQVMEVLVELHEEVGDDGSDL